MDRGSAISLTARKFKYAAEELGIDMIAPYTLPFQGGQVIYVAYLPHFGGPRGMVVGGVLSFEEPDIDRIKRCAEEAGLYRSIVALLQSVDTPFTIEQLKEALVDWGYYGPTEKRPSWLDETPIPGSVFLPDF